MSDCAQFILRSFLLSVDRLGARFLCCWRRSSPGGESIAPPLSMSEVWIPVPHGPPGRCTVQSLKPAVEMGVTRKARTSKKEPNERGKKGRYRNAKGVCARPTCAACAHVPAGAPGLHRPLRCCCRQTGSFKVAVRRLPPSSHLFLPFLILPLRGVWCSYIARACVGSAARDGFYCWVGEPAPQLCTDNAARRSRLGKDAHVSRNRDG